MSDDKKYDDLLIKIQQYKNSIMKHADLGNEEKIISYMKRLVEMPITYEHLIQSGIGKTIHSLRKYSGKVGLMSKAIVSKWRALVAVENTKKDTDGEPEAGTKEKLSKSKEKQEKCNSSSSSHKKSKSHDKSSDKDRKYKTDKHDKSNKSSHSKHHHSSHSSKEESSNKYKRKHDEESTTSKKKKYETETSNSTNNKYSSEQGHSVKSKNKHKDHKKNKEKHEQKEKRQSNNVSMNKSDEDNDGINHNSGKSFAEALGMIEPTSYRKKISSPTPSTSKSSKKSEIKMRIHSPLTLNDNILQPSYKLETLETTLPEITTNYKPLPQHYSFSNSNIKNLTEEETLSVVISSKTQRTKVYSGNKTVWNFVPSLFQLCVKVLQDNIDALEYTGGIPYEILQPVLARASPNQLLNVEFHNPYLLEDTNELWELHCRHECRGMQRQEMESWRDLFLRCRDERDAKLRAITCNIKQSIDKLTPVRQTKLAYVDSIVKPPRAIARKQLKNGISNIIKPLITPSQRLNAIAAGNSQKSITVPNPGVRASTFSTPATTKPKKAPLMMKTLALMKGSRLGRR